MTATALDPREEALLEHYRSGFLRARWVDILSCLVDRAGRCALPRTKRKKPAGRPRVGAIPLIRLLEELDAVFDRYDHAVRTGWD